jgi:tRNA pseudouridine38-40 synthase
MRIAMKFAYNGTQFHGYARQPNVKTIEDELFKILLSNNIITDLKTDCVRTASRTDKGVSALGNIIAFNTDSWDPKKIQHLSKKNTNIFIYGWSQVPPDFYPRYARQRIYRYYLKKDQMDLEKLYQTASVFTGEHNFCNFARIEPLKDPIRTIDTIVFSEQKSFIIIDFYAQTFLWNQIRRIVSALQKVAIDKLTQKQVELALNHSEKKVDYGLAPPEPLLLKDVIYDFEFTYEKNTKQNLRRFEQSIVLSLQQNLDG